MTQWGAIHFKPNQTKPNPTMTTSFPFEQHFVRECSSGNLDAAKSLWTATPPEHRPPHVITAAFFAAIDAAKDHVCDWLAEVAADNIGAIVARAFQRACFLNDVDAMRGLLAHPPPFAPTVGQIRAAALTAQQVGYTELADVLCAELADSP